MTPHRFTLGSGTPVETREGATIAAVARSSQDRRRHRPAIVLLLDETAEKSPSRDGRIRPA
jgi:hypothetical protein